MQIFNSVSKQTIRSRIMRARMNLAALIPIQPDLFNGKDIPELLNTQQTYQKVNEYLDATSGASKATFIVDNLLVNYFAVAREVAIQTYTNNWFKNEPDDQFKVALATELTNTFGIDGYRNAIWDFFAGIQE